jgi:hypothetical protein
LRKIKLQPLVELTAPLFASVFLVCAKDESGMKSMNLNQTTGATTPDLQRHSRIGPVISYQGI